MKWLILVVALILFAMAALVKAVDTVVERRWQQRCEQVGLR